MQYLKNREGSSFSGFCTRVFIFRGFRFRKSLQENLVIHSYKTILYCPFARSNNCNITLINNSQIIRFVVDQFIGSTFYAEQQHLAFWFSFTLDLNFILLVFVFYKFLNIHYHSQKQKKMKYKPVNKYNTNRNKYGHCRGNKPYKSSVVLTSFTSIVYCQVFNLRCIGALDKKKYRH